MRLAQIYHLSRYSGLVLIDLHQCHRQNEVFQVSLLAVEAKEVVDVGAIQMML